MMMRKRKKRVKMKSKKRTRKRLKRKPNGRMGMLLIESKLASNLSTNTHN